MASEPPSRQTRSVPGGGAFRATMGKGARAIRSEKKR